MNNNHIYDMLVVGGGPGGYTAALYAARAGLDTVVLEKLSAGGQMALTEQIDNYPGFEDGIDGFSLAEKMQKQAERFKHAAGIRGSSPHGSDGGSWALVETSEGSSGENRGAGHRCGPQNAGRCRRGGAGGRGVAHRAACDGMFYKGKTVVVGGRRKSRRGGRFLLSRVAKKVILVHRRDALRATKIYRAAGHRPKRGISAGTAPFPCCFPGQADRRPLAGHRYR